jgi:hypothetical protein
MVPDNSPDEAAFRSILEQATNFGRCTEIALQVGNSQKEKALKRALELVVHYDEAIYVYMASNDSGLQNEAIAKAINITDDFNHLDFWVTKAPTDELKALAKTKLNQLKKEVNR